MKDLKAILEQFDSKRNELKNDELWNESVVADCFHSCAKEILLGGYFLIDKKYIIDLGSIELYYHEEEGEIKDYIMYHTNEHPSKSRVFNIEGGYPYFEFGSFNLHQSGIDVTFENEEEKYRASFLIRSYRVLKNGESPKDSQKPYDICSTHLFDDMFYGGISEQNISRIKWVSYNKGGRIVRCPRRNVAEYCINGQNKIVKAVSTITDEEYKVNTSRYIKVNGVYYKQDKRSWQFKRENIVEK
ncbi:MAG: hypothetical protein K5778_10680 [Bacteroidaceae bacterium]|nr:hypothetical protein [Bacteroidaceae bacterium]